MSTARQRLQDIAEKLGAQDVMGPKGRRPVGAQAVNTFSAIFMNLNDGLGHLAWHGPAKGLAREPGPVVISSLIKFFAVMNGVRKQDRIAVSSGLARATDRAGVLHGAGSGQLVDASVDKNLAHQWEQPAPITGASGFTARVADLFERTEVVVDNSNRRRASEQRISAQQRQVAVPAQTGGTLPAGKLPEVAWPGS